MAAGMFLEFVMLVSGIWFCITSLRRIQFKCILGMNVVFSGARNKVDCKGKALCRCAIFGCSRKSACAGGLFLHYIHCLGSVLLQITPYFSLFKLLSIDLISSWVMNLCKSGLHKVCGPY